MRLNLYLLAGAFLAATVGKAAGATPPAIDFKDSVAPILQKHCQACHSNPGGNQGRLNLESYAKLMEGGKSGAAVVAGKSAESLIVQLVEGTKQPKMPPAGPGLTPGELKTLKAWIDSGAKETIPIKVNEEKKSKPAPSPSQKKAPQKKSEQKPLPSSASPSANPHSEVVSAAFSPDGKRVAAGGRGEVRLFDTATGKLIARLAGPVGVATAVAFSSNGKWIAAAGGQPGQGGEIRIWNATTLAPHRTLRGHSDALYGMAFSPDSRSLVAGSYDRQVSLWDLTKNTPPRMLKDHTDAVYGVAFSPDGRRIASVSSDRTVKLWEAATGKRLYTPGDSTAELYAVAFSPDGKSIAAGGADKRLRTWSLSDTGGSLLKSAFAHDGEIVRVLFSPDGKTLYSAGEDGSLKSWEAATLTERKALDHQPEWVHALAVSPNGKQIAVGRFNGSLSVHDAASGRSVITLLKGRPPVKPVSASQATSPLPKAPAAHRFPPLDSKIPDGDGGAVVRPASLDRTAPNALLRGETKTLTLFGKRIGTATAIFMDDPGLKARILEETGEKKDENQLKVEVVAAPSTRLGAHRVFAQTPWGATGAVTFVVGGWPEVSEKEPNESPQQATSVSLPSTAVGGLEKPGDADTFTFQAKAGQEIVFELVAGPLRSRLNGILTLLDAEGKTLAEARRTTQQADPVLGYRFTADGTYALKITDAENGAGATTIYRLNIGEFPYVTRVFPLGVRQGEATDIHLEGFNVPKTVRITAPVEPSPTRGRRHPLPIPVADGTSLAIPHLEVGEGPQTQAAEGSRMVQRVESPHAIHGRISGEGEEDRFRFLAKKGQPLLLEVTARRLGSPLDSLIEVLDVQGRPIERARLRSVAETFITLNDPDSSRGGFRISAWNDLAMNDYILVGRELLRIKDLPRGPDDDIQFHSLRGQRTGYLDTTPEQHAMDSPVYKVEIHPPGAQLTPNGMPVYPLYTRNDDGGPLFGKDSYLTFTPPNDGEYLVRIADTRGEGGEDYAYRLTLREPRPDFRISLNPPHPNVQRGSSMTVDVIAERYDGFDGEIAVKLSDLPPGITATETVIRPGQEAATLTLTAAPDAPAPAAGRPTVSFKVTGTAQINGKPLVREVPPDMGVRLATVIPDPDLRVTTERNRIALAPGKETKLTAHIERRHGFKGRVPLSVRNLPYGVRVLDVGLNGVLITENETHREFTLYAEPWVQPITTPIYVTAQVEGGMSSASPPITLDVASVSKDKAIKQALRK